MSLHRRFLLGLIVMYVSVEVVVVKATDLIRSVFILNTKWTNMEKTCEYHNAKVVIVPAVFSSPWIASQYPAHVPNWSPQLPLTVMRSLAQSTKGACVRCSPTPTPARLSPAVWLMCSICWMMDWARQGKSSHTFPVHVVGRPGWPCRAAQGPPPMCHCWFLALLVLQLVPSFKARQRLCCPNAITALNCAWAALSLPGMEKGGDAEREFLCIQSVSTNITHNEHMV